MALLDWLACAARGVREPAAQAARTLGDRVAFAGTAGHVLDFDDTYLPGLAHLSAPCAPAALVLAAELGRDAGAALDAYAHGFEAMGALTRASHPALYDGGWHPSAMCGGVGAAVAAAELLDAPRDDAVALALLRSGGLRAAFGSPGKSLQVGLAAASGVRAARLAGAGVRMSLAAAARGWEQASGGGFARPVEAEPAIERNWIKAWPCCLQTHGAIEAADGVRERAARELTVAVHPVSLQAAAHGPEPADGLQAKFSIPYLTAYTLAHGPPRVESFDAVDPRWPSAPGRSKSQRRAPARVRVRAEAGGEQLARVRAALGSPQRPLDARRAAGEAGGAGRSAAGRRARRPRAPRGGAAGLASACEALLHHHATAACRAPRSPA